jgi:hypothetical protein
MGKYMVRGKGLVGEKAGKAGRKAGKLESEDFP